MFRTHLTLTVLAIVLVVDCSTSDAALMSVNDAIFGANSFTRDTATGLEWLDINFSDGMNFQTVSGQFGAGGTFAGLRHATSAELNQFILNAGINPAAIALFNLTPVQNLETLVGGPTGIQSISGGGISLGSFTVTYGMTSDVTGASMVNYGGVSWTSSTLLGGPGGFGNAMIGSQSISTVNNDLGHWLVRTVPEPSAALLALIGASALIATAGRRRT